MPERIDVFISSTSKDLKKYRAKVKEAVLTLGLFVLIVNWAMLSLTIWISSEVFNLGFTSDGFWSTFFGAIVISIVSGVLNIFLRDDKEDGNTIIVQR